MSLPADPAAPTSRLLIIGDSITLAAVEVRGKDVLDHVRPSYVELLRQMLPRVEIITDAAVRRTTIGARECLAALLEQHRPGAVMLMIGTSDADLDWRRFILSKGQNSRSHVPVQRYGENLRAMIAQIRAAAAIPILTDLPNHDIEARGRYFSGLFGVEVSGFLLDGGGRTESDRRWAQYHDALTAVAAEMSCELAAYGRSMDNHPASSMFGPDATHPSAEGHRVIADALAPTLAHVLSHRSATARSPSPPI